jgi:hypothetical protein
MELSRDLASAERAALERPLRLVHFFTSREGKKKGRF